MTRERSAPARQYDVITMDQLEQLVADDYAANCRKSAFRIRPAFRHLRSHFGDYFLVDRASGELFCLKGGYDDGERGRPVARKPQMEERAPEKVPRGASGLGVPPGARSTS